MSDYAFGVKRGLSFVVQNTASPAKAVNIFGLTIYPGGTAELMNVPSLSEDDLRVSILKGELGAKLSAGQLTVVSSTINFESSDASYTAVLTGFGLSASTNSASGGNVADIASLALINAASEVDGSTRFVESIQTKFILDKSSALTADNITVVATKSGTGRWVRDLTSFHSDWAYRTAWYLDPLNGNDENDGGTSSVALKTLREVTRRLNTGMPRSLVTLNVLNNITDAADYMALDTRLNPQGAFGATAPALAGTAGIIGSNIALRILGQRIAASFTDPNTSSTTSLTMTSNCLSPDLTQGTAGPSGTSGLPVVLTVSGFDFTPHIGKNIEILTSAQANAVGAIGTIVAAPSSGVAWLQPLVKLSDATAISVGATQLNAADYPQSGSTFRIYTNTTWAANSHVGSIGALGTTFIAVRNIEFPAVTGAQINRSQQMIYEGCTFKRIITQSSGSEGSVIWVMLGTSVVFPAPTGGRTPTQYAPVTSGEIRWGCCAFINCDMRLRESKSSANFANCLFYGSCIMAGGPNDAGRAGAISPLFALPPACGLTIAGTDFGTGFFNWPAPDALAPIGSARGSSGAAIHVGHGAKAVFTTKLYGYNATSGTFGILVQEGAMALVSEQCTYQASPVNLGGVNPPYIAASLRLTGQAGDFKLDGYASHMPDGYWQDFVVGARPAGASNVLPISSWKTWEDAPFSRNVKSNKTGASILNILI